MLVAHWEETLSKYRDEIAMHHPECPDGLTFSEIEKAAGTIDVSAEVILAYGHRVDFFARLIAAWRAEKPVLLLENSSSQIRPILTAIPAGTRLIKQTCGASGIERSLFFDEAAVIAEGKANVEGLGLKREWRGLAAISLAHSYGFGCLVLPLLLTGIPLDIAAGPLPMFMNSALARGGKVFLPAVPAIWKTWLQTGIAAHPAIQLAVSAGSPLSIKMEQQALEEAGLKIHNFYGTSETGAISFDSTNQLRESSTQVGKLLSGVTAELGENARLSFSTSARASGADRLLTPTEFSQPSYLTMDQGRFEGREVFVNRCIGKAVNVAGRKVSSEKLRKIFEELEGVHFASVECGKSRDFERYEEIYVRLRVKPGFEKKIAREAIRQKIQSWEMPRAWEIEEV